MYSFGRVKRIEPWGPRRAQTRHKIPNELHRKINYLFKKGFRQPERLMSLSVKI